MNIGSPALGRERHDCRDGENKTEAPQDNLPFAITRGQHNAIGVNLEHAAQRMPGWRPRTALCSYSAANCYALRMYSRKTGPMAALPSPPREKGVGPEPLSWRS